MRRKPYTRYSREFKLEAFRQAALGEKPKAQIARALGIRVGHLRDWRATGDTVTFGEKVRFNFLFASGYGNRIPTTR